MVGDDDGRRRRGSRRSGHKTRIDILRHWGRGRPARGRDEVSNRHTMVGDVKRITRAKHIGAFARDNVRWTL